MSVDQPFKRETDKGFLCLVALRAGQFWEFIDRRQIDAYAVSLIILWGTIRITEWAMAFVDAHPDIDGLKAAAVIGSIMGPWSLLQGAAIKFLFDARSRSFHQTQPSAP